MRWVLLLVFAVTAVGCVTNAPPTKAPPCACKGRSGGGGLRSAR